MDKELVHKRLAALRNDLDLLRNDYLRVEGAIAVLEAILVDDEPTSEEDTDAAN